MARQKQGASRRLPESEMRYAPGTRVYVKWDPYQACHPGEVGGCTVRGGRVTDLFGAPLEHYVGPFWHWWWMVPRVPVRVCHGEYEGDGGQVLAHQGVRRRALDRRVTEPGD